MTYEEYLFSQLYTLHKGGNTPYDLLFPKIKEAFKAFVAADDNSLPLYEAIEEFLTTI